MSTFNQGIPGVPTLINSSQVLLTGNAASANALTVRQFGTGNVFSAQTTSGTTALFVGANGNVGIGKTNPVAPLDVVGTVTATSLVGTMYGALAGSNTVSATSATFSATPAAAANVLTVIGSSTTGNVVQFSNTAGGNFIMTSAGNVGIGKTNPVAPLDVAGTVITSGQVQSLDSLRAHSLPSDAMIVASSTLVTPTNQNPGSYAIVESGVNSLGVTTTGSVPAVTQSPFADLYKEGSIYFNGSTGNYLQNTATYSNSTIQWSTTGMTVEAWVNYPTFTNAAVNQGSGLFQPTLFGMMAPTTNSNYWGFGANTTGYVTLWYSAATSQSVTAQTPISANTWNHIAMTSSTSGQIFLFINGVQAQVVANRNGSVQSAAYFESAQATPQVASFFLTMGQFNSTAVNAYVADLRLTTGTPVYTGSTSSFATFTVPSAPLSPAATGTTQFLLRAGQNSPTVQNGALTFDRGLKQYIEYGPQTFNLATRGFTAVFRWQNTGTAGSFERIFEFGNDYVNTTTCSSIAVWRDSQNLYFRIYPPGNATATGVFGGVFLQNTTYTVACRYDPTTLLMTIWLNGVLIGTPTSLSLANAADRTLATVRVGADCTGPNASYGPQQVRCLTASMNTFAIYNRALSNVEILNAYSALTTTPATPLQKTLEIGDINGVPALSVAGNGQVSVQSIGLSSNVVPWPPAAMTGYDTVINGGVYKARASSEFSSIYLAWYAFDRSSSSIWVGTSSLYSTSSPYAYTGTTTTTDVNGTIYRGDWVQLQVPSAISLTSYSIMTDGGNIPNAWVILGSRDGVNWTPLDFQNGITSGFTASTYRNFTVNSVSTATYNYMRIVLLRFIGSQATLSDLVFYGTADASPTLTIVPATTFNTSVATPSLTGIAAAGVYAPQDFSTSGLNIPAYVVSNTATVANTVAYSSFGPFAGEGSLYFGYPPTTTLNQCGAYVNLGPTTPPNFTPVGTPFTIEGWIYVQGSSSDGNYYIFLNRGSPNSGAGSSYDMTSFVVNGSFYFTLISLSPNNVGLAGVVYNAWNHVSGSWNGTNTLYVSVNGTVASQAVTGTPAFNSAYSFLVGAQGGAYNMRGYVAGVRVTRGAALYTSSFTPPTGPLQPIQGTTQAGLPYGTVLLLRNAPAPGRIQTTKFSGANSGQVLSFPPAAMTGYSTALSSGYGQGTYVASASSEFPTPAAGYPYAWYAFDKTTTNYFVSNAPLYGSSSPYAYTGTVTTVDITGTSYAGEWLQIQKPVSTIISSYIITCNGISAAPQRFVVLGSRDGVNWFLVDSRSGVTWTTTGQSLTFSTQVSQSYIYYRIVTMNLQGNGTYVQMQELVFNGTIESVNISADGRVGLGVVSPTRALEVAGDIVCSGTVSSQSTTFRNVLYNGDVRINQRGISTTVGSPTAMGTSSTAYTVDRWLCYRGSYAAGGTVAQGTITSVDLPYQNDGLVNFLRIGRSVGDTSLQTIYVADVLETRDSIRLAGKIVTMSFYYRTGAAFAGTLQAIVTTSTGTDQNYTIAWAGRVNQTNYLPSSTAWTKYSFSAQVPVSATQVAATFVYSPTTATAVANDYYDVTGVQLEKGTVATPFEVRPFATELALCQRYFQLYNTSGGSGVSNGILGIGHVTSTSAVQVAIPLKVSMRVGPTSFSSTAVGNYIMTQGGTGYPITSFAMPYVSSEVVWFQTANSGTFATVGGAAIFYAANSSGFLGFSAEL